MDEKELTSVWQQLQQRLSRYARQVFSRTEEAEDALQDTFCSLWLHRNDIKSSSHAQALAVTAVKHASIDLHRRKNVRHEVPLDADTPGAYSHVAEDTEMHETFGNIEQIIMSQLSEREKAVFKMKEYDCLKTEEIAGKLQISDEAVRKALSRARIKIRQYYIKQYS
ncbi:MAG: RNA polymerase sigma factor [Muribaculaceae bacterium]